MITNKSDDYPLISIVIATFNSEKILPLVLKSIKKQNYPQKNIEVLIVDGGSQDKTIKIANDFNCRIIHNYKTEPVYAKYLGLLNAEGRYIMYLDHDEVIENPDSLKLKHQIFATNDRVKAIICSGYRTTKKYGFFNQYLSEFGDPFSFFMYRLSKDTAFFLSEMKNHYKVIAENKDSVIFDFYAIKNLPLIELVAMGSVVDREYAIDKFPHIVQEPEMIPHLFYLLVSKSALVANAKNDSIIHYSTENFRQYIKKIRWRIENNIHYRYSIGFSGYSGREKFQNKLQKYKKFLFIPYTYSILLPTIDAFLLAARRKKISYFLHVILCIYSSNLIIFNYFLKIFGIKIRAKNYDGSKLN